MEKQILQERAGLYCLLRALHSYPLTESLLTKVSDLSVMPRSSLSAGLSEMQAYLYDCEQMTAMLETLNVEMSGLLEGPGLTPVPPFASYYLHNGQLMGPASQCARETYLNWQVLPDGDTRLPDDHITLELGFLAHLANLAAEGKEETEAVLQASREFLCAQLIPWLPRFSHAMSQAAKTAFFKGLAKLTISVVQADVDWLNHVLDEKSKVPVSLNGKEFGNE